MGITEKGLIVAVRIGENDLGTTNPELIKEWHPSLNGELTPQHFTAGSNKKVWWLGICGHDWEAIVSGRSKGTGCPYCSGQRIWVGFNDLFTVKPELAGQLHPSKNGKLTAKQLTGNSGKKVWWLGICGHDWEAVIYSRSKGAGCPYCSGKQIWLGFNDLLTVNPELAGQLHPTKNEALTAQQLTAASNKKVWWLGICGHDWEAVVDNRVRGGYGCPYCSGQRIWVGFNDLFTVNPELAGQLHPTKNGKLTAQQLAANSHKKVWWLGLCGHHWGAAVSGRAKGTGCPYCSGKQIWLGFNDLLTVNPELAGQLHPTKNEALTAQQLTAASNKKVWWLGICGHDWEASVSGRTRGYDCPYCSGQRIWVGFNDLLTVNPELAGQLHPTKNGALTAQQLTAKSGKKVWWLGFCGHDWDAAVCNRSNGSGCPNCSVGTTEKIFCGVFTKHSGFYFESDRIDLIRISRQRDRAQIDMLNDILKIVIEYDGAWTHGENSKFNTTLGQRLAQDKETTEALVKLGYNVIRIREHDTRQELPMVPINPVYAANVYQITYKSFGKDKNDIEELVQRIIEEKAEWFRISSELVIAA